MHELTWMMMLWSIYWQFWQKWRWVQDERCVDLIGWSRIRIWSFGLELDPILPWALRLLFLKTEFPALQVRLFWRPRRRLHDHDWRCDQLWNQWVMICCLLATAAENEWSIWLQLWSCCCSCFVNNLTLLNVIILPARHSFYQGAYAGQIIRHQVKFQAKIVKFQVKMIKFQANQVKFQANKVK